MLSVEYLREFVNERLNVAAEEIMGIFEKTIFEYEEEIDRQRKLLDSVWNPEINLHRIELPHQHVCQQEEVLSDQLLCIQERNSSLDQEDPEPPQMEEEQEELYTSQEIEQIEVKQEIETFMLTPSDEETDYSDTEPNSDDQLLSHNYHVAESHDWEGSKNEDSGSNGNAEPKSHKRRHKSYSNNVNNSNLLKIHHNTQAGKAFYQCHTCGKAFKFKSQLYIHLRIHRAEKPHSCNVCGKRFSQISTLNNHVRIHTGDLKPYSCKICGKEFRSNSYLTVHLRTHTGEKPYSCNTCGKDFRTNSHLIDHMRIHTGEKPYSCKICGKHFRSSSNLMSHTKTHTGEKPHSCKTCGKCFTRNNDLTAHVRRAHTGERPYLCKICGKRYFDAYQLGRHTRSHTDQ